MTDDPPEQPRKNDPARQPRRVVQRRVEIAKWEAPFPPPAMMREIDEIAPGSAKQIMDRFVSEGEHRHKMETRAQWLPSLDQIFARVAGLCFAGGCLWLISYAISVQAYWSAAVLSAAMVFGGINAIMSRK